MCKSRQSVAEALLTLCSRKEVQLADQIMSNPEGKVAAPVVDALVYRALSTVAAKNCKPDLEICEDALHRLYCASSDLSADKVEAVIKEMLLSGIPAEMISDFYIPLVARKMGEEWVNDDMNFASVTIGTARLQSAMRFLSTCWAPACPSDRDSGMLSVIVIVGQDVFHTLGAVVLSSQLRRMGVSVRLTMGASLNELRDLFKVSRFDAVLVSSSGSETLESLAEMVKTIRQSALDCPPVVIGGNVLGQGVDVKALTGADFTTADPSKALEYCRLVTNRTVNRLLPEQRS